MSLLMGSAAAHSRAGSRGPAIREPRAKAKAILAALTLATTCFVVAAGGAGAASPDSSPSAADSPSAVVSPSAAVSPAGSIQPAQAGSATIQVSPAKDTIAVGDSVKVDLLIQTDDPVSTVAADLKFDNRILQVVSVAAGTAWTGTTLTLNGNPVANPRLSTRPTHRPRRRSQAPSASCRR